MKRHLSAIFLGATLAAFSFPALAQTTTDPATVQGRKENQQDRIGQGIQSGQLTPGETANLEKKESSVNQEERDMRKLDNGHLTAADRATLNQQQNQLSNNIYKDKHNGNVQNTNPKSEVGKRAENQQDRIAQGVKSGQLTAGETANLESKDTRINREIHNDRAANGGKLTGAEKGQINHQQNKVSRQIYRDKHNGRKQ